LAVHVGDGLVSASSIVGVEPNRLGIEDPKALGDGASSKPQTPEQNICSPKKAISLRPRKPVGVRGVDVAAIGR